MAGSSYFEFYDRSLRRLGMLEWLRDEDLRRRASRLTERRTSGQGAEPAPYWVRLQRQTQEPRA